MSEEMAYMEILSVSHSEGTHYTVKDLTAETQQIIQQDTLARPLPLP